MGCSHKKNFGWCPNFVGSETEPQRHRDRERPGTHSPWLCVSVPLWLISQIAFKSGHYRISSYGHEIVVVEQNQHKVISSPYPGRWTALLAGVVERDLLQP